MIQMVMNWHELPILPLTCFEDQVCLGFQPIHLSSPFFRCPGFGVEYVSVPGRFQVPSRFHQVYIRFHVCFVCFEFVFKRTLCTLKVFYIRTPALQPRRDSRVPFWLCSSRRGNQTMHQTHKLKPTKHWEFEQNPTVWKHIP